MSLAIKRTGTTKHTNKPEKIYIRQKQCIQNLGSSVNSVFLTRKVLNLGSSVNSDFLTTKVLTLFCLGGGGECPPRFQLSRNFLIFKVTVQFERFFQ